EVSLGILRDARREELRERELEVSAGGRGLEVRRRRRRIRCNERRAEEGCALCELRAAEVDAAIEFGLCEVGATFEVRVDEGRGERRSVEGHVLQERRAAEIDRAAERDVRGVDWAGEDAAAALERPRHDVDRGEIERPDDPVWAENDPSAGTERCGDLQTGYG